MEQSIEFKITDSLFKLIFENQGIICGSPIREFALPSKNNKVCPNELYIHANNVESFCRTIQSSLKFCFDIKTENYHKNVVMYLNYKFQTDITFVINIYQHNFQIPNTLIDVNNLVMIKLDSYNVPKDTSILNNLTYSKHLKFQRAIEDNWVLLNHRLTYYVLLKQCIMLLKC